MSRLGPLPFRKVQRALLALGFLPTRQKGSHVLFVHADGRRTVVPRHGREEIGPGLLRRILQEADIDPNEFAEHV